MTCALIRMSVSYPPMYVRWHLNDVSSGYKLVTVITVCPGTTDHCYPIRTLLVWPEELVWCQKYLHFVC